MVQIRSNKEIGNKFHVIQALKRLDTLEIIFDEPFKAKLQKVQKVNN